MNPEGRHNPKKIYMLSNLGILLVLALAISTLFLQNYRKATQKHYENLREEILRSKHEFIKDAVDRTIQHIEQERRLCASGSSGRCDEAAVKERLREHIRAIRLKDDGYIWVNAVINYAGGDNYAYRFVHPNLPKTEGMMLSTTIRDIKGNTPYLTELEGVKKHGEIFFDYWFKKMNSDVIQHKLTYARLYLPYGWIVATGVYLDDVDQIVQSGMAAWEASIHDNVLFALAMTGIAAFLAWGLSLLVGKRVDTIYNYFLREVEKREKDLTLLNLELEERVVLRTSEIEASEKKYLDLYENAPDLYVSADASTWEIERCNATLATALGYSRDEIVGKSVTELYHPDCADDVLKTYRYVGETGEIHDRELILRRKDGSKLDASLSVSVVRDENGAILYSRSTLRDITERKRAEKVTLARLRMLETTYAADINLHDLLRLMLDEIEAQTGSCIGFYHFMEEDQQTVSLQNWSTNTLTTICTAEGNCSHYHMAKAGVWADCVRERRPVIHNDYPSLANRRGLPDGHAPIIRELIVPVLRGHRIVAVIGVGNKPEEYGETDVQITSLLGDFSWEIVTRKQAEEQLKKLNRLLEARILERTEELTAKNSELERMNKIFVGRELRMVELKERIRELERGQTP